MYAAVDAVVFSVVQKQLCVLLITNKFPPFEHRFALPGGRVGAREELLTAVQRKLKEETNVNNIFLKQFGAYGAVDRDPRNRVLSIAYLALINSEQFNLQASGGAERAEWTPLNAVGALSFDHNKILQDGLAALRYELQTSTIAAQLLPAKFTLSDLQTLYERVLDRELDKRNFRKRIEELDFLEDTGEQRRDGAHRPAQLYTFRTQEYRPLREAIRIFV